MCEMSHDEIGDLADEAERAGRLEKEVEQLQAALRGLMEAFRLEFDSQDGRWIADDEPAMKAATSALGQPSPD